MGSASVVKDHTLAFFCFGTLPLLFPPVMTVMNQINCKEYQRANSAAGSDTVLTVRWWLGGETLSDSQMVAADSDRGGQIIEVTTTCGVILMSAPPSGDLG